MTTLSSYHIPVVRFLIPYILGIIVCQYASFTLKLIILFCAIILFLVATYLTKNRWQNYFTLLFCLLLGSYSYQPFTSELLHQNGRSSSFLQGRLIIHSISKQNKKQINFITKVEGQQYMAYLKKNRNDYLPTDTLILSKFKIKLFCQKDLTEGLHKNYVKYLVSKGIKGQIFIQDKDVVIHAPGHGIIRTAYSIRLNIIELIKKENIFSKKEEGVFYSLIIGERSYLYKDTKQQFKESGIIHVLAISGLHVGILFILIQAIMRACRVRSQGAKLISVFFILTLYALLAGLSPSVVRAALMCSLIQLGSFLCVRKVLLNIVLCSALMLLLLKPQWIWDLGFLLSYSAVIFIILVLNRFQGMTAVIKNSFLQKTAQLSLVNIAAFTGTLPLIASNFGTAYLGSLLASLLIIPLVSILVLLGVLTVLLSPISQVLRPLLFVNHYLIKLLNFGAVFFSENLSFPIVLSLNAAQAAILYVIFFTFLLKRMSLIQKFVVLFACSSLLLVFKFSS